MTLWKEVAVDVRPAERRRPLGADFLRALPAGENPAHCCNSAHTHKTQECHVRIPGEQMKHTSGKRRNCGKPKETVDEISDVRHAAVSQECCKRCSRSCHRESEMSLSGNISDLGLFT